MKSTKDNNQRAIKELLEVIKHKVAGTEARVRMLSIRVESIKDQQSVMNEKLDNLQEGMDELNKKADVIFQHSPDVDDDLQDVKKRITRIEKIPAIAHELKK